MEDVPLYILQGHYSRHPLPVSLEEGIVGLYNEVESQPLYLSIFFTVNLVSDSTPSERCLRPLVVRTSPCRLRFHTPRPDVRVL